MAAIERITRTYRHLGRDRKILAVLARHGFGELLRRLGVERYVESGLQLFGSEPEADLRLRPAERLRHALAELGPTFIKLGQLLSTRPDLIPIDVARELEKLQDQAPAFAGEEARRIVSQELDRPVDEIYAIFETEPFAAASLGQVHRGVLAEDGREVVVKVQRPAIRQTVETDLEIIEHLATIAERHADLRVHRPAAIVAEFRRALAKELDYTVEAAHLRRFGMMFAGDPTVRIPDLVPERTSSRVLTMERLPGIKVSKLVESPGAFDRDRIARRGADAILRQIFDFGFFHADPHPGNVLILPDDVVGLIDLGQVGRLDRATRYLVAQLFGSLVASDVEGASSAFLELTDSEVEPDRHALESDVAEIIDWHLARPVGEMQLGRTVWRLLEIATRHRRSVAPEIFLVMKALATLDGLVRELDPAFDLPSHSRPLLRRLAREQFSPPKLAASAWEASLQLSRLVRELPRELSESLRRLARGRVRLALEHHKLYPLVRTLEVAANRLVFAIVLAALLIASSLVVLADVPPKWHDVPVIGLAGYLLAAVIGFGLLWSILRRGGLSARERDKLD